eukprot:COSAG03_NODE_785_length_5865_cov_146.513917_11_plen_44_part_01
MRTTVDKNTTTLIDTDRSLIEPELAKLPELHTHKRTHTRARTHT